MKNNSQRLTYTILVVASVLAMLTSVQAGQQVPIQKKYDGLTIGNVEAPFHLEAFYDLQCPDSVASNNILNNVFKQIDFYNQN